MKQRQSPQTGNGLARHKQYITGWESKSIYRTISITRKTLWLMRLGKVQQGNAKHLLYNVIVEQSPYIHSSDVRLVTGVSGNQYSGNGGRCSAGWLSYVWRLLQTLRSRILSASSCRCDTYNRVSPIHWRFKIELLSKAKTINTW